MVVFDEYFTLIIGFREKNPPKISLSCQGRPVEQSQLRSIEKIQICYPLWPTMMASILHRRSCPASTIRWKSEIMTAHMCEDTAHKTMLSNWQTDVSQLDMAT